MPFLPSPDARLSLGLLAVSVISLGAFLWTGFGQLPERSVVVGEPLRLARREAGTTFADVTFQSGLAGFRHDTIGLDSIQDSVAPGLGLLDLDEDRDLDLVLLGGPGAETGISIFVSRGQGSIEFEDVTTRVGVEWRGNAQGVCAGDYDSDGDIDLFVTAIGPNLLLKNLLQETGTLAFEDATAAAGVAGGRYHILPNDLANPPQPGRGGAGTLDVPEFSTGASFGDFDRDGRLDLYVANYVGFHRDMLFAGLAEIEQLVDDLEALAQEQPDGETADLARELHAIEDELQVPAADLRGTLERITEIQQMLAPERAELSLQPPEELRAYLPEWSSQKDRLYRNTGQGGFIEVTDFFDLHDEGGRGLSAAFVQSDDDLRPDIYVAEDSKLGNKLLRNQIQPQQTQEQLRRSLPSQAREIGLSDLGASCGFATGDADSDGDVDIVVTNGPGFPHSLYTATSLRPHQTAGGRLPGVVFENISQDAGLGEFTEAQHGRGVVFLDYDNDGRQDLAIAHGSGLPDQSGLQCVPGRLQLFRNISGGGSVRFIDVSEDAGEAFATPYQGRGLVTGDLDRDGDLDLVLSQNNGPIVVLENRLPPGKNHATPSLSFARWEEDPAQPAPPQLARGEALSAQVLLETTSGVQVRQLVSGGSYLSQGPLEPHFGLGEVRRFVLTLISPYQPVLPHHTHSWLTRAEPDRD